MFRTNIRYFLNINLWYKVNFWEKMIEAKIYREIQTEIKQNKQYFCYCLLYILNVQRLNNLVSLIYLVLMLWK